MRTSLILDDKTNEHDKIWRYMNMTKFLDLILNRSLYLRRIDKFEDPYEGFISDSYKSDLDDRYSELGKFMDLSKDSVSELTKTTRDGLELMPAYAYANCWFLGDEESAAMWKLYGEHKDSIAICSTINDLKLSVEQFDHQNSGVLHMRPVVYVSTGSVAKSDNIIQPMFEKRISFTHEQEFRILYLLDRAYANLTYIHRKNTPKDKDSVGTEDGINIDIDVRKLIKKVYISPKASSNFKSIVEKTLQLSGFSEIECIQSELYTLK